MLPSFSKIVEKINWKHWLFFFIASQSIYVTMLTLVIPRITRESGGMKIFDMLPRGYTSDYVQSFLNNLSEHGYVLYQYVQLPLDILFPAFHFAAGFCMIVLLLRLFTLMSQTYSVLLPWISLPFVFLAMLFDYLENIFIFIVLSLKENTPNYVMTLSSISTQFKSMFTMIFYSVSLVLVLLISIKWIQNKLRERNIVEEVQSTRKEKSTAKNRHT